MASFDYRQMRAESLAALDAADYSPKKTIMIHSGVTIGLGLLLSVFTYLLDLGINQTGGLGGIGVRAVLETVQSMLQTTNLVLLPFWAIGYTRVAINWTRRQRSDAIMLLTGFRYLGPVLRLLLVQALIYVVLGMLGAYAGASLFMMTPGAEPLMALTEEMANAGITDAGLLLENEAYLSAALPMVPYMLVAAAVLIIPVAYRLRFAEFALMDHPRGGALRAVRKSWRMTRRNCLSLLKLDLRFWWYHLAVVLIAVLGYGDVLLAIAGIELGISADAAMFAFYIFALLCEFALYVWRKNQVSTVYALAYEQLSEPVEEAMNAQMRSYPWNQ